MCYFLTIAMPMDAQRMLSTLEHRTISFMATNNLSFRPLAPGKWASFFVIAGGCSCDLYKRSPGLKENEDEIQKLRRKGWSDNKIARALSSKKQSQRHGAGLRDDVLDVITKLVTTHGSVRLFLHWYTGDIETEKFDVRDKGRISLQEFRADSAVLGDDTTLLVFEREFQKSKDEPGDTPNPHSPSAQGVGGR